MSDTSSNAFWQSAQNYQSFELRTHRFRQEMLPLFYQWLGITPQSIFLDGGCGSGVFTRYLAKDLTTGHVTGFDINETFIAHGKTKIAELSLSDRMTLEVADGFDLPYETNNFDAVTNYTYIGVLSDPERGLRELIRVCKPGGVVSCVVATRAMSNIGGQGSYPFAGATELQRMSALEGRVFNEINPVVKSELSIELSLYQNSELAEIHIYPFAHLICYNDSNLPLEYRLNHALEEINEEIRMLEGRFAVHEEAYAKRGFSRDDCTQLIELLQAKRNYLSLHFEEDRSYEWHGGFNYIITGKKE